MESQKCKSPFCIKVNTEESDFSLPQYIGRKGIGRENGNIDQTPTLHAVWCGRSTQILDEGDTEPLQMINPRFQGLKDAGMELG